MKKISKKLSLNTETVRMLSGPELEQAVGGNGPAAVGETVRNTIMRVNPSLAAAAAAPCIRHSAAAAAIACRLTGGVHTAPCAAR